MALLGIAAYTLRTRSDFAFAEADSRGSQGNGEGGGGAEDGKEEEDGKAHGGGSYMPCEYLGMEEPSKAEF